MTNKRKTNSERTQERYEAKSRAWELFRPQLKSLKTFEEALALVTRMPAPDTPGRIFYTNLQFFLQGFTVPGNSTSEERAIYLSFVRHLDTEGKLKPGAFEKIEAALRAK